MKTITVLCAAILMVFSSCSYEPGVSEAMTKYRFKDGVTTITVPGWVVGLASNFGDLDESEQELLSSIDKVKVIAVEDDELNAKIDLHKEFYEKVNRKNEYEELMVVRDDEQSVTIFGKMKGSTIREMIILVGGEDNALVYLKGEFSPDLLKDKVNLKDTDKFLSFNF